MWMDEMVKLWGLTWRALEKWIARLDLAQAKAKLVSDFCYCWPVACEVGRGEEEKGAWLEVEGLRHALIERIDLSQAYVPHNVALGGRAAADGLMLYGLNGTGKSSVMKAVGICVVLAQAGWPVPASAMRWAPFRAVLTRIVGADNLFRGRSTFATEMFELRSILDRHDAHTLVLGDELCHGTESDSQMALIVATVARLASRSSKFVMATHNHPVATHPVVRGLARVKVAHLASRREGDHIVYSRELVEGAGDPLYGIEVAEALQLPADVVRMAYEIREGGEGGGGGRSSRYHSAYRLGMCEICGEVPASETHHLMMQAGGERDGVFMHQQSNLVGICEGCHVRAHTAGITWRKVSLASGLTKLEPA
jgi:DNA mismatch repair protein MutS